MKKLLNEELNRKSPEEFRKTGKFPIVVVLDNVRSHFNVGSVFRTADAFLVESIVLCGITATPPHREINKTALGATETVSWRYSADTVATVRQLKDEGYTVVAVEQTTHSQPLQSFKQEDLRYAFVFGNEIRGVDQAAIDMCDFSIEVPQLGTKHSINISVCTGIVLWEFFKFFQKKRRP